MLSPFATAVTWPIAGDVPDLQAIVWSQMAVIAANEALLHAYQANLSNAQAIPPASGLGTANAAFSQQVVMTGVVGTIALGSTVTGTAIPGGTIVTGQTAGLPGGNGTYFFSNSIVATNLSLPFTPGGGNSPWPATTLQATLMLLTQDQQAVAKLHNALLTAYQTLMTDSALVPPATGP